MRKSQGTTKNVFYFYLCIQKTLYFVRKYLWINLVYIIKFVLQLISVAVVWNAIIEHHTHLYGLVEAALRPKILGNRLGILS